MEKNQQSYQKKYYNMNIINQINYEDHIQNNRYYNNIRQFFQTTQINYWTGNPSRQIKSGTIFFKPITTNPLHQNFLSFCQELRLHTQITHKCIAMIGIPISKSPLQVIADINILIDQNQLMTEFQQIKVIKTDQPQYYLMAFKFIKQDDSLKFYRLLFGKKFNSIQRYRILLRQIEYITMNFDQPNFLKFITTKIELLTSEKLAPQYIFEKQSLSLQSQIYNKQFQCTLCQKNIIQISQQHNNTIILLLCSHFFHVTCLEKQSPIACPICSYSISMEKYYYCQCCCASQKNWICLECLNIFCFKHKQENINKSHIWQHYIKNNHSKFISLQQKNVLNLKNIKKQLPYEEVKNYIRYLDQSFIQFEQSLVQNKKTHAVSRNKFDQIINQLKKQINQINDQEDFDQINQQIQKLEKQSEMHHKVHKLLGDRITQLNKQENKILKYSQQIQHKKRRLLELQNQIKGKPHKTLQLTKQKLNSYKQMNKITKQI